MGDLSIPRASRVRRRSAGGWWFAAFPFALSWSVAATALNASLAPPSVDLPLLEAPRAPPASSPPATHHDDLVYDASELISV